MSDLSHTTSLRKLARSYRVDLSERLRQGWDHFWFRPIDPATIGAIRFCTGLVLLYVYLGTASQTISLVGPDGWIDQAAIRELRTVARGDGERAALVDRRWWAQSAWFYVQSPELIWAFQGLFIAAICCFTIGLFARTANVLVWAGHISIVVRSYVTSYGLDSVLAMLTWYLMFAPSGDALAIDAWRQSRIGGSRYQGRTAAKTRPSLSWTANLVVRLIQIHVCVIYLCSGLAKLQGETWWNGTAIWRVLMAEDLARFDLRWLASLGNPGVSLIFQPAAAATLAFEISFAFLIWNRWWRPLLLCGAVVLHGCIGILMGLEAFSAAMLTACLAFVSPEIVRGFVDFNLKPLLARLSAPRRSRKSLVAGSKRHA
jgi:hypothetical protein